MVRRRITAEDGFTIIEVLVAIVLIAVGVLGTFATLDSSSHLTASSQREQAAMTAAEQAMEQVRANTYTNIAIGTPLPTAAGTDGNASTDHSGNPTNPNYWVSGTSLKIPANFNQESSGTLTGVSSSGEPFVTGGSVVPSSSVTTGGYSATVYRYVTWVNDTCNYGGTDKCSGAQDAKRITIAVVLGGTQNNTGVQKPVWLTSVVANPKAGGS